MISSAFERSTTKERVRQIADKLLTTQAHADELTTETQEEYDLLYEAVSTGSLTNDFNLGRSGIWLRKRRVNPPKALAFN